MNSKNFIAFPPANNSQPIDAAKTAKEVIELLCEEVKNRQDPELISKISEVKGLYTGYDAISHPDLADTVIMKLGLVIDYLLKKTSFDPFSAFLEKNHTDLIFFLQQQREHLEKNDRRIFSVKAFIEQFDRYLELQGKKEQTRKIYRGKVAAAFRNFNIETPIRITDLESSLREILLRCNETPKKDHNLNSAIGSLLDFIAELLGV